MQPRVFRNFQPGDHIRTKKGEIFQVKERITYYCKKCNCKPLDPCAKMQEMTTLILESQRGMWEMNLKTLNEKYLQEQIDLWT